MYTRILVALWLIAAVTADARAQNDAAAPPRSPSAAPPSIAALQQELRQAGFDPGPVNGVMTEQTTRALLAYERRTRRLPQSIAAVGPDAADPVLRAQQSLRQLGFFAGRPDGVLGPQTRDAIIRFEVSRHLPVDPRVSDQLLAALTETGALPASNTVAAPLATPPPAASSAAAPPQTPAPQVAAGPATPEATGRQALPSWVNPPPIR